MPFRVSPRALERLEWPDVVAQLRAAASTPRVRARLAATEDAGVSLFAQSEDEAWRLLRETAEARGMLVRHELPPFGGLSDLDASLGRLGKGGALGARELLDLRGLLAALHGTRRHLARRESEAPELAAIAGTIGDLGDLEEDIAYAIDVEGEVRDAASPALADARREAHGLAGELQRRLSAYLSDPELSACLSDRFVTVRNDRFVLPVRSDARGRVKGIVHDASGSGTTVFIEPEAVVELNNRLKHAELTVQRETLRVLRDLSDRAARALPWIETGLEALVRLDLAFARARLAEAWNGVAPEVGTGSILRAPQLRHPLLPPDRVVPNDLALGDGWHVLVLSGPNAGGKTVMLKAAGLAALCVRAGLFVPAAPGARVDLFDVVLADIGDEQSLRESLSTFSAHVAGLARIVDEADARALVLLDEIGSGTDPGEGACLAQAILEALAEAGARVVATTHFGLLKEMAAVDPRFANASFDFDPDTDAPTYRMRMGVAGASSATAVAARMGLRSDVLARARALLEREDRRLDLMLAELAASRAQLEREREEARHLRVESEAARAEYREKLERLQERRDKLFAEMRDGLDRSFRHAHAEVAAVIRDLQRGGSARDAAHARERLLALEERAQEAAVASGLAPSADEETAAAPVDWSALRPGDGVGLRGGANAVLVELPDRRGRVVVQAGSARMVVSREQLVMPWPEARRGGAPAGPRRPAPHVTLERTVEADDVGAGGCDLRGLRVGEAVERLVSALDRAAAEGRSRLRVLHGLGSGALKDAVRGHLAASPYVARFLPGDAHEGGEGVTIVELVTA
jgi:DNA mismatch repair protein MutS2